ncbi:Uma2 family endonuclease [Pseudoflavonifractor phocaeensis]|uniref:Uma2 family endonuclease n=1 Tax=Pseudoflavonifractor phocaeensis TaxID=1870988 RepID=UPI0019566FFE|nr:Uma2 family endonuclease [Pseudoflavonifractor phocaeensis]MBM6926929.1 Uma2 family endonuclease [Pseudoflavonifractor phocaeensis]
MPLPKEHRYTLADALTWEEQERIELIDGAAVMMAPPSRVHQEIAAELTRQIGNYLDGKKCRVYPAPFAVRLFEKAHDRPEDVDTLVEPDLSVVCDPGKLDDLGCKGAPDLVIEILSPSTQRHDRLTKYNLYERAGVAEYWIVSPEERTVQVSLLSGGRYRVAELYTPQDIAKVHVLDGCFVELSKVFPTE